MLHCVLYHCDHGRSVLENWRGQTIRRLLLSNIPCLPHFLSMCDNSFITLWFAKSSLYLNLYVYIFALLVFVITVFSRFSMNTSCSYSTDHLTLLRTHYIYSILCAWSSFTVYLTNVVLMHIIGLDQESKDQYVFKTRKPLWTCQVQDCLFHRNCVCGQRMS